MTQNLLELAQQGDTKAITNLVYDWLGLPDVTAIAKLKKDYLPVMGESREVPEQKSVVPIIQDGLKTLSLESVTNVKISGRWWRNWWCCNANYPGRRTRIEQTLYFI